MAMVGVALRCFTRHRQAAPHRTAPTSPYALPVDSAGISNFTCIVFLIEVPGPRRSPTPKRHSNGAVAGLEVVLIRVMPMMVKHPPRSAADKVKTCTLKSALGAGFNQPVSVANGRWILDGVDGLGVMITAHQSTVDAVEP